MEAGSGPILAPYGRSSQVHLGADDAGLHPDPLAAVLHLNLAPMARHLHQDAVA